jgi:(1->4)-alpha-D-glucan 1-alpha-D-glucosylmutase
MPDLWRTSLRKWRAVNRRWKRAVNEIDAPDGNEEYLLYQSLIGTWPMQMSGQPEPTVNDDYIARIQSYMAKALHEAKLNTSWIQPNEAWDAAMRDFVARILEPSSRNKFLPLFLPVAAEFARLGAINSLSQTLLKLTSPGLPDIYQGNEIWDFSLVDPDNRRPVDYARRRELLDSIASANPGEVLRSWPDGRIKMFLIQRVLQFRQANSDLFHHGEYFSIGAQGTFGECCVSFARKLDRQWIVVIAPRLSSRVGFPPVGEFWKDTRVELPKSMDSAHDLFTSREMRSAQIRMADAMSILPFAVITSS